MPPTAEGRPLPILDHGIRVGDHPAVGRQLPQPTLDGRPLDDLLGSGFAIVTDTPRASTPLGDLAHVVVIPADAMPMVLPPGGAVIVRPDRYVAAVAHDDTELDAAGTALLDQLGITATPSGSTP